MATTSITTAVRLKYESLTAANFPGSVRPPIHFGQAPMVDGSPLLLAPPYVVLREPNRQIRTLDFERNNLVTLQLALDVYSGDGPNLEQTVGAIRLNGGTIGQGLGFDYGTLSDLSSPRSTHQMVPVGEPRQLAPQKDKEGNPIAVARLEYRVTILESS